MKTERIMIECLLEKGHCQERVSFDKRANGHFSRLCPLHALTVLELAVPITPMFQSKLRLPRCVLWPSRCSASRDRRPATMAHFLYIVLVAYPAGCLLPSSIPLTSHAAVGTMYACIIETADPSLDSTRAIVMRIWESKSAKSRDSTALSRSTI